MNIDESVFCMPIYPMQGNYIVMNIEESVFCMPILLLNACVRVADVMIFTFVSLMPVHNVCRICKIIKESV